MKTSAIRWIVILLAFTLSVSAARAVGGGPCGNNEVGGVAGTGSITPEGTSSEEPTSTVTGDPPGTEPTPERKKSDPVIPYTGNEYKEIEDLQLWGSVGNLPMRWIRRANSRAVGGASLFGVAHYWRHNFQWELSTTAADELGRARLTMIYPDGAKFIFTETAPGTWTPDNAVTDRLTPTEDGFVLQRKDASRYFFRAIPSGETTYYVMDRIQDHASNIYTLTYNTARRVTRVTEPAGRYFQVSYKTLTGNKLNVTTLATLATAPETNQWVEFTITNTNAYRYIWALQADLSYGNIAEVEFYEAGTDAKLSGVVICSDAPETGQLAFDGDPATGFVSAAASGGYVGYDLGEAKQIGRVRFLSMAGKEPSQVPTGWGYQPLRIQGANEAPISTTAISKVETSDGRSVVYEYTAFEDPSLPYTFPVLSAAIYGDGTRAEYKYIQVFPGARPLISEWDDVRNPLPQPRYKTIYQDERTGGVLGAVSAQVNLETGGSIVTIGIAGSLHKPKVTYANGGTEIQVYDTSLPTGATITKDITANGNTNTYTYGTDGYMTTQTDSLGHTTSYTWTPYGKPLTITYADGATESWTYNDVGLVLSHTNPLGRVTSYTRDSSNRVTRIDWPADSFETFAYNGFGQVVSHQQRNGGIETFTYDARGLLISKTDALGNVTGYGYDANDRLARVTDARGNSTFMEYNERGLVTKTTYADSSFKTWTYNKYGDVLSQTDELGHTLSYTRNVFGRVTSITDPLGRTSTSEYLADSYVDKPLSKTSPSGRKTAFSYDKAWNTLSITNGAGTAEAAVTKFTYNKANKVLTTTDPRGKVTTFTYDVRDRRISATDPLSHTTQWSYDAVGNVLSVTRPDGGVTTNVYDEMNFLVWTRDPKMQVTEFTYDIADNLVALKDARGNSYQFTYDFLNRRTSMIYPDTSHEDYNYDAVGNLYTYRNRAGSIRTFTYDNRNRETLADWSDSTPDVSKTYDAAGRLLTLNNGVSALSYTYDNANQLLSETSVLGSQFSVVGYTYDADGNRQSLTYPDSTVVNYDYSARNQLASVSSESSVVAFYEYDLSGNRTGKTLGNGLFAKYTYDAASRLTSLAHTNIAQATSLTRFNYTLDSVGNRTNKTQTTPKPTSGNWVRKEPYSYDAVDQIIGVQYITNNVTMRDVSYQYDAIGNRSQVTDNGSPTGYTANELNQYTVVDGATLGYDANGNLASASGPPPLGNATAQYDAQNRLVSASGGPSSVTATFAYDARNRCVARTINSVTTYLIYDGWSLIEERDATGAQIARYIHGTATDEILLRSTATSTVYYHHDGLGSTIALTDSQGLIVESYQYDVFGTPSFFDSSFITLPSSLAGNRFLFTGREYLAELALYDYRNRFYSPIIGRFLQPDSIGFDAGDANLLRYCGNSPVSFIDSFGLCRKQGKDRSCVPATLGYMVEYLTGQEIPEATNRAHYATVEGHPSHDWNRDGTRPQNTVLVVQRFYTNLTASIGNAKDITNAINNKIPVMATVTSSPSGQNHAVMITGYTGVGSNLTYVGRNPTTGEPTIYPASRINTNWPIITIQKK